MFRAIARIALVAISFAGSASNANGQEAATPGAPAALAEYVREVSLAADPAGAPGGMAIDAAGTLYVADTKNDRIRVFDAAGKPVGTWGSAGTGPGQFRFQGAGFWGDVALGPDGNLYVLDTFNNRVQVLARTGRSSGNGVEQGPTRANCCFRRASRPTAWAASTSPTPATRGCRCSTAMGRCSSPGQRPPPPTRRPSRRTPPSTPRGTRG